MLVRYAIPIVGVSNKILLWSAKQCLSTIKGLFLCSAWFSVWYTLPTRGYCVVSAGSTTKVKLLW